MNQDISRRTFLNRSLAGTFVIGFELRKIEAKLYWQRIFLN